MVAVAVITDAPTPAGNAWVAEVVPPPKSCTSGSAAVASPQSTAHPATVPAPAAVVDPRDSVYVPPSATVGSPEAVTAGGVAVAAVTGADGAEESPPPSAVTVNVYGVPADRPVAAYVVDPPSTSSSGS